MPIRQSRGGAQLSTIVAELTRMSDGVTIPRIMEAELAKAARPFAPRVRAAIMNTPTHGVKHSGLRARIAGCVQPWAKIRGPVVQVGIEVDSSRMPDGQKSLPLMLEGAKIWRHPVYGHRDRWVPQESHPYFYGAVGPLGPASRLAIDRALQKITDQISGLRRAA